MSNIHKVASLPNVIIQLRPLYFSELVGNTIHNLMMLSVCTMHV